MREGMTQRRGLFAVGAELRPHLDDWHVVVELVPFHQEVHAGRGHALGRRRQHEERVAVHGPPGGLVGHACPGVDDQLAVEVCATCRPIPGVSRTSASSTALTFALAGLSPLRDWAASAVRPSDAAVADSARPRMKLASGQVHAVGFLSIPTATCHLLSSVPAPFSTIPSPGYGT